jgi:glycosyltransferase involved in cell wall biosynthesis
MPSERAHVSASRHTAMGSTVSNNPTIAIVPWGDLWEDFYGSIGVPFDEFCNEFSGSWSFKLVRALKCVGVEVVTYYSSLRVAAPTRYRHRPTDSTICLLPAPFIYRAIRRKMVHPHGCFGYWEQLQDLFGESAAKHPLFFGALKQIAPYLAMSAMELARQLRYDRCSAVLCQDYEHAIFDKCMLIAKVLRIPGFAIFQGGGADWNRIGRTLRPLSLQAAAGLIIGSSYEIKRVTCSYPEIRNKLSKIFNPVDPEMFLQSDRAEARRAIGIAQDATVVLWHGRVEIEAKGLDNLLVAWEQVCRNREPSQLLLVLMGWGRDFNKLAHAIAALPFKNVLWIDSFVSDRARLQQFFAAGDIYAFPSRHEGLPIAPTEAMANGLPVVAADASGVRDIFEGGEASGGLIVPFNDADAFATALGSLIDNKRLRLALGRQARVRALHFSEKIIGNELKELFFADTPSDGITSGANLTKIS